MKKSFKFIVFLIGTLILAGCANSPESPSAEQPSDSVPSIEELPTEELSIENLDYSLVGLRAFASVNNKLEQAPDFKSPAKFIVGPNVLEAEVMLEKELIDASVKIFSEWYMPEEFKVVMFSERDGEWAEQIQKKHGGSYISNITEEIGFWTENGGVCGFAFATRTKNDTPIYYGCTDSYRIRDWPGRQTPPHEYFHLVQDQYGELPQWLLEGSAAFFGAAIGYFELSPDGAKSKEFFRGTSGNFDPNNEGPDNNRLVLQLRNLTVDESLKMYRDLEDFDWKNGDRLGHYALGGLATEVLVGVWGLDRYMEMLVGTSTKSWKSSFTATYGMKPDEFYEKIVPYLRAAGQQMSIG